MSKASRCRRGGGVELVDGVSQLHAESRLDLGCFACHQETVEVLEHLDIAAPSRRRQAIGHELGDDSVNVVRACLPRRHGQQSQEPLQHARGVLDEDRAKTPGRPRRDKTPPRKTTGNFRIKWAGDRQRVCQLPPIDRPFPLAHLLPATETKVAPNNGTSHLRSGGSP